MLSMEIECGASDHDDMFYRARAFNGVDVRREVIMLDDEHVFAQASDGG